MSTPNLSPAIQQLCADALSTANTELVQFRLQLVSARETLEETTRNLYRMEKLKVAFEATIHGGEEFGKGVVSGILSNANMKQEDLEKLFPADGSSAAAVVNPVINQDIYSMVSNLETVRDSQVLDCETLEKNIRERSNIVSSISAAIYDESASNIIASYFYNKGVDPSFITQNFPKFTPPQI